MKVSKKLLALALTATFGLAACDGDAQPDPGQMDPGMEAGQEQTPEMGQDMGQEMDPEMMAMMTEVQELQQRLGPIQDEAMQDPELSQSLTELQDRVETAMRDEDPELFAEMDQFEEEFLAAQEAGDQERIQEIGMEAQGVEMELQTLQQSVLEREDIRTSIDDFEAAQRERMIEIDPEAGEIMDRIDEILAELQGS